MSDSIIEQRIIEIAVDANDSVEKLKQFQDVLAATDEALARFGTSGSTGVTGLISQFELLNTVAKNYFATLQQISGLSILPPNTSPIIPPGGTNNGGPYLLNAPPQPYGLLGTGIAPGVTVGSPYTPGLSGSIDPTMINYGNQFHDPFGIYGAGDNAPPSEFYGRMQAGQQGVVSQAELALQAEALHAQAQAMRDAGKEADVYSDGVIRVKNAQGQLEEATTGGSNSLGYIERAMLRSLVVYGLLWGAINTVSQAFGSWVQANQMADLSLQELSFIAQGTGQSIDQLAEHQKAQLNIAAQYGVMPQQALPVVTYAARTTPNQAEQDALTRGASQLSQFGGIVPEEAAQKIFQITKDFNLSLTETQQIVDVAAAAFKNSNVPVSQFLDTLDRVAPIGHAAGMSFQETAGYLDGLLQVTGRAPSQIESMLEEVSNLQNRSADVKQLGALGISTQDANGAALPAPQQIDAIVQQWGKLTDAQKEQATIATFGQRYLNEGLNILNQYGRVTADMDKFNSSFGQGNELIDARNRSMVQQLQLIQAGIAAELNDPHAFNPRQGQAGAFNNLPDWNPPPISPELMQQLAIQQMYGRQRQIESEGGFLPPNPLATPPPSQYGIGPQGGRAPGSLYSYQPTPIQYPAVSQQSGLSDAQLAESVEKAKQLAAQYMEAVRAAGGDTQKLSDQWANTSGAITTSDGKIHLFNGSIAALLPQAIQITQELEKWKAPNLQISTSSSSQLEKDIATARQLADQYLASLRASGHDTTAIEQSWKGISSEIRTADGVMHLVTGSAAAFLSQAQQIGQAMKQWQAPNLQVTDMTPTDYTKNLQIANQLAQQYVQSIRASNLPADAQNQIIKQTTDQWSQTVVMIRLANGALVTLQGPAAAFLSQAEQITAQWQRAMQEMQRAQQVNVQSNTSLNAGNVGQLQQYLSMYEQILAKAGVQQQPQEYLIFGQNGFSAKFFTSSQALQLALELLGQQVSDQTSATKANTHANDALRGHFNLPTDFGYKPPTAWEYYDRTGNQDKGPINYPWDFPGQDGSGSTSKVGIGFVPGGVGSLYPTTFGDKLPTPESQAILEGTSATTLNTAATNANTEAILARDRGETGSGGYGTQGEARDSFWSQRQTPSNDNRDSFWSNRPVTAPNATHSAQALTPEAMRLALETAIRNAADNPLHGKETAITQLFGENQLPIYAQHGLKGHEGLDIAAPYGTPVYAAAPGTIEKTGYGPDYGYQVWEKMANGAELLYAHLVGLLPTLKVGQTVDQNTQIGNVGISGDSTGPHLHFGYKPGDPSQAPAGFGGWGNPQDFFDSMAQGGGMTVTGMTQVQTNTQQISQSAQSLVAQVPPGLNNLAIQMSYSNITLAAMLQQLMAIRVGVTQPTPEPIIYVTAAGSDASIQSAAAGNIGSGVTGALA